MSCYFYSCVDKPCLGLPMTVRFCLNIYLNIKLSIQKDGFCFSRHCTRFVVLLGINGARALLPLKKNMWLMINTILLGVFLFSTLPQFVFLSVLCFTDLDPLNLDMDSAMALLSRYSKYHMDSDRESYSFIHFQRYFAIFMFNAVCCLTECICRKP